MFISASCAEAQFDLTYDKFATAGMSQVRERQPIASVERTEHYPTMDRPDEVSLTVPVLDAPSPEEALRLATAFVKISDPAKRAELLELAERLAGIRRPDKA